MALSRPWHEHDDEETSQLGTEASLGGPRASQGAARSNAIACSTISNPARGPTNRGRAFHEARLYLERADGRRRARLRAVVTLHAVELAACSSGFPPRTSSRASQRGTCDEEEEKKVTGTTTPGFGRRWSPSTGGFPRTGDVAPRGRGRRKATSANFRVGVGPPRRQHHGRRRAAASHRP